MKKSRYLFLIAAVLLIPVKGHHYKGLPHYGYFENYPQVPNLEFLKETPFNEMFVTIFNFQGMNMNMVAAPDDVRFYIFVYDLVADKIFTGAANFTISSHGKKIYGSGRLLPQSEAIYVVSCKIVEQDDLLLSAELESVDGAPVTIEMPIRITRGFAEKHGVWLTIVLFFVLVSTLKALLNRRARHLAGPT